MLEDWVKKKDKPDRLFQFVNMTFACTILMVAMVFFYLSLKHTEVEC